MFLRQLAFPRTALIGLAVLALPAAGLAQDLRLEASHLRTMEWRNIGPLRGGRSLSCIGSPGRRHEYYFGATGGGLWKTLDSGTTWFPVTDGQISSSSIGAVAVAETNPDIVFIGGGETQLRGSITQGDGVYKSSDGGEDLAPRGPPRHPGGGPHPHPSGEPRHRLCGRARPSLR